MSLLKMSGPNHEAMVKEAFMRMAGKLLLGAAKKPLTAIGSYFNAKQVVEGSGRMNQQSGIGRALGNVASNTPGINTT